MSFAKKNPTTVHNWWHHQLSPQTSWILMI